jgi:hypothetical protein
MGSAPRLNPGLDLLAWHGLTCPLELVQTPSVFLDIRSFDVHNGIEQHHGIGDHRSGVLALLGCERADPGIDGRIEIKSARTVLPAVHPLFPAKSLNCQGSSATSATATDA